jgi:hypothetical protein
MNGRMARRSLFLVVSAVLVAGLCLTAHAAPTITSIAPRGLQIGHTTTIVVTGSDLSADLQLLSDAKIASQKVKAGAKPNRVELEIELDQSTPAGLYAVRVASASGISSPVVVGVDRLPQRTFTTTIGKMPASLSGIVGGAEVLSAKFTGKKGQKLILDVEAQRLGSPLKPVLRLNDARGTQIAFSPPRSVIGGDARIEMELPADGDYSLELHDELFRPAGNGFFRLKVGDLHYADLALPLGVAIGGKRAIEAVSTNISATTELSVADSAIPGETFAPFTSVGSFTGSSPRVAVSDFPELTERLASASSRNEPGEDAGAKQNVLQDLPAAPFAISGRLSKAGEEDKYLLTVAPKQRLRFDFFARQYGSPLDGVLTIRKEDGSEQLATGDDRPGSSDPLVDYTVPAGVTKLQVVVKDLLGRGGSDYVYRLVVSDQRSPDFSLSLMADKINIPAGATQVVPVQVTRLSYNGPVELALAGQPSEVSVQGNVIPAGATIGLLTLTAKDVSPQSGLTKLIGRATEPMPQPVRAAMFGEFGGSKYQPRLRTDLGLSITRPAPLSFAWIPGDNDQLYLGGKLAARVQFTRAAGSKEKVRLKLLTSQPVPKKTLQAAPKAPQRVVDDVDRTLRLEGDPTFGPDKSEATVNILIPSDLPKQPWDLVLVAEILSPDGKTTLSTIASPVRSLSPVAPFTLALTGENRAEGKAGLGDPGKLTGKIERSPGYALPVLVTLDSLPKGYVAPQVLVPGDKSEFELPLTFASSVKAGEVKGAKLVAYSAPVVVKSVKSNTIDVSINVTSGEKPTLEMPKEVFEDSEQFITMLNEGNGRAIPDQRQAYSGKYGLRVTPDQRFNTKLPNLGVKIRENPGPGEYRYIRFAWQKAQGNAICLQLAHDGKFGPLKGAGREGAKFRYHAGGGDEPFGGSLQLADKIPAKFELVTRDLFLDFGEFTFTGLAFSPIDGQSAIFDHMYLARSPEEFDLIKVEKGGE